jgi:hypothetical protein
VPSCRRRRSASPRASSGARLAAIVLCVAVVGAACGGEPPTVGPAPSAANGDLPGDVPGAVVIVLPPADGLAVAERDRLRLLVARALDDAFPSGTDGVPDPVVIEPADAASIVDAVEGAIRRAGARGTVCVLGADVRELLAPLLALYPATRVCLLPVNGLGEDGALASDVDLERFGRELGGSARRAAGEGTVLVLAGGDAMLDRRWWTGLEAVVAAPSEHASGPGAMYTARTAADVLAFLDEQEALVAQGILPGVPGTQGSDTGPGAFEQPFRDDALPSRVLPPVGVVVLDASREAALLVGPLADRGVRVIAPRSLLLATDAPGDEVVLRWRIRWDVPLAELLRRAVLGEDPAPLRGEVLVLEPGPAHVAP